MNGRKLTYTDTYAELAQVTLDYLLTVDTPEKASAFVTQATGVIRGTLAKTPQLHPKDLIEVLRVMVIEKIEEDISDCRREIERANTEGRIATSELTARLRAARRAGNSADEQAIFRDQKVMQASCQAKVDDARRRIKIISVQIDAFKDLALAFGVRFVRPVITNSSQNRAVQVPPVHAEPLREESLSDLLSELDALIGLDPVKAIVHQLIDMAQVEQMRRTAGLPVTRVSRHLVFTGNPGTGKTTVARLLARLYKAIGILKTGQLIEVSRSDLVAGYVGQTAIKTTEAVKRALGGILFIDEAYSLSRRSGLGQDFGQEAIDTLVKLMEDHRDELVIIAAGYNNEMTQLLSSNTGLPSRFPQTIEFPDYTSDELVAIFRQMCANGRYEVSAEILNALHHYLDGLRRIQGFGNGRLIRNIFESTLARQASRIIATSSSNLTQLITADLGLPNGDFTATMK
jgi:SpoVK/Ycf46/Vps4 family AAA+-type ATPase